MVKKHIKELLHPIVGTAEKPFKGMETALEIAMEQALLYQSPVFIIADPVHGYCSALGVNEFRSNGLPHGYIKTGQLQYEDAKRMWQERIDRQKDSVT